MKNDETYYEQIRAFSFRGWTLRIWIEDKNESEEALYKIMKAVSMGLEDAYDKCVGTCTPRVLAEAGLKIAKINAIEVLDHNLHGAVLYKSRYHLPK